MAKGRLAWPPPLFGKGFEMNPAAAKRSKATRGECDVAPGSVVIRPVGNEFDVVVLVNGKVTKRIKEIKCVEEARKVANDVARKMIAEAEGG